MEFSEHREKAKSPMDEYTEKLKSEEKKDRLPQKSRVQSTDFVPDLSNPKARQGILKCPTQYVPPIIMMHLGLAMKSGAEKYGPFNWREDPICASIYKGAMDRHLSSWFDGEDVDPGSGCHPLAHVAASCALVLDSLACESLIDDRPKGGPTPRFILETTGSSGDAE